MKQLLLSISLLAAVSAAPNVIADYRIRNPDITPALGRGYSLTSYDVLSTCLAFDETTQPTYNYDYSMIETTSDGSHTTDVSASVQASVSFGWIKATIDASVKSHSKTTRHSHYISTRMATERYYSSVDDTTAKLTPDALALVERGDLVGFFQACGSGYIRSIRRTAEFAAVFEFSSDSATTSREMALKVQLQIKGFFTGGKSVQFEMNAKTESTSKDSEMKITIKGYGLGLNGVGADTLVARDLEEYDAALKYAFKSMQTEGVGQIHGVEVVSWANNLQFQNAIRFEQEQAIEWTAKAGSVASTGGYFLHSPKEKTFLTYTIEGSEQKETEGDPGYVAAIPDSIYPLMIEAVEVKAITMINAEFITGLEAYYRKEMHTITKFISCLVDLNALNVAGKGNNYLQDNTDFALVRESASRDEAITVMDAMNVVNAANYKIRMNSLKNFVKYFYGRCASEISRHSTSGAMTKYWWDIVECLPTKVTDDTTEADSAPGTIETDCLLPGMFFMAPYAANPDNGGTGSMAATCMLQSTDAYNDRYLDMYCMPVIEASGRTRPSPPSSSAPPGGRRRLDEEQGGRSLFAAEQAFGVPAKPTSKPTPKSTPKSTPKPTSKPTPKSTAPKPTPKPKPSSLPPPSLSPPLPPPPQWKRASPETVYGEPAAAAEYERREQPPSSTPP